MASRIKNEIEETNGSVVAKAKRGNTRKPKVEVAEEKLHKIDIPKIETGEVILTLVGTNPLLVNNKMNVAAELDAIYNVQGGKASAIKKPKASPDEMYRRAFYVMPSSKYQPPSEKALYGIPASGVKKCFDKAIRTTGITDNTTIGTISRSFFIEEDEGGYIQIAYKKLVRDIRPVNIGSGQKTVPQLRHRPMFMGWTADVRVSFNSKIIGVDQLVNLGLHAGLFIGLCELRAEKKQGLCGSFRIDVNNKKQK